MSKEIRVLLINIGWLAVLVALTLLLHGCTVIRYRGATYVSVMTRRAATVEVGADGSVKASYNTESQGAEAFGRAVGEALKVYGGGK
jgi:hypothetical protein